MKTLIGGAIAAVLGLIGLAVWWKPFLSLLAGSVPIGLLVGGGLALYLGFDELKDTWKKDDTAETMKDEEDVDSLKKKIEELEKEKAALKTQA
ncbi:conserved hypothetical protein [Candidatus Magnetomoraceae bacterium gMMP-15]